MLRIKIENEQQRDQLVHGAGVLHFGRQPREDGQCVVIDDAYVSRDQFEIEELPDGKVRLLSRGRNEVCVGDGEPVGRGEQRELPLPIHVVVGKTTIDVDRATDDEMSRKFQRTVRTAAFDDLKKVSIENIADHYPFPLAFGFRLSTGITNSPELYKQQLRLAENLLAFVASLSLALLDDQQLITLNDKSQGSALSHWQGGISPGDWLSLAIHAAEQLDRSDAGPLTQGLVHLQLNKENRGMGKLLRALIKAKNDFKHDRGPSIESEYSRATDATGETLLEAYQFLAFLTEHAIRLVQDVNPRRRGSQSDVLFLKCMGDHPGFVSEESVTSQNLRKGDLYIEAEPERLTPLFPFITAATCQQCKSRELFFVDRWAAGRPDDAGMATLKSFDRGHTVEDPAVGEELSQIFRAT